MKNLKQDEGFRVSTIEQHNHNARGLWLLKREMDKIRLQFSRIKQDDVKMKELDEPDTAKVRWTDADYQKQRHEANVALFADIHFLLISLNNFANIFKILKTQLHTNKEIVTIYTKYDKTAFLDYDTFRNHLEHIYERIGRVSDLGNLSNWNFTFDGKTFDIGSNRETEIETIFSETLTALEKSTER